jgi:FkbM family methyltransferase
MSLYRALRTTAKHWRRAVFERLGSDRYSHLALNDLDRKLTAYISDRNGTFNEAGANDGLTQSNTYWFERFRGWRGILIEPVPMMAEACRRNRPRAKVINAALVANGEIKSLRMKAANLMAFVSNSFVNPQDEERHLKNAISVQSLSAVEEVEVPARTLSGILDELGITRVDLLSLDVEGYEIEVLTGLDVTRHRPRFILVETNKVDRVLDTLAGGYDLLDQLTSHDYLLRAKP